MENEISLFRQPTKRKRSEGAAATGDRTTIGTRLNLQSQLHEQSESSSLPSSKLRRTGEVLSAKVVSVAPHAKDFAALGLSKWLVAAVQSMGIRVPTPVQAACIPPALSGRDVVGCAQTGSGKTAAFALPILHALGDDPYGIFAVVLTPSRELAFQIGEQFMVFGAPLGVRVAIITGGVDLIKQGLELAELPHIVVATPGRLAHHLRLGVSPPNLSRSPWLVMDECDRLADPSMAPDLSEVIYACSHPRRQTLLFSATVPPSLRSGGAIPGLHLRSPYVFDVNEYGSRERDEDEMDGEEVAASGALQHEVLAPVTAAGLIQQYCFMPATVKNAYLVHLITRLGPIDIVVSMPGQDRDRSGTGSSSSSGRGGGRGGRAAAGGGKSKHRKSTAMSGKEAFAQADEDAEDEDRARSLIIFVSRCRGAALISELLREVGIPCVALHSVMTQQERLGSLAKFKSSLVRVLVATDVASRGLDIPNVDLVLNCDVPRTPSDYVHRVGRTARAGRGGRAVTLVTQYDIDLLHEIETRVPGGKQLAALPAGTVDEDKDILPRLGAIATSLHLAKVRLRDTGMEGKLELAKSRKAENKERQANFHAAAGAIDGVGR